MLKKFLLAVVLCILFAFLLPLPTTATAEKVTGQFIIINKASNELAYYENNKLNRIFRVATGKRPSLTPEGNFFIVNKIINRPYYKDGIPGGDPRNPLGDRWLGLNARKTWGTTYGIHGNNNPNSIGKYASLGCVRMYDEEIHWLFEQVKVNTPVIIVTLADSFDNIAKANDLDVIQTAQGSAPPITFTLLKLGSNNEEVKSYQQQLIILDYLQGEVSGVFDESTELAISQFQATNDLTVDGIIGPETKRTLRDLVASKLVNEPEAVPSERSVATATPGKSENNSTTTPTQPDPDKTTASQSNPKQPTNTTTNPEEAQPSDISKSPDSEPVENGGSNSTDIKAPPKSKTDLAEKVEKSVSDKNNQQAEEQKKSSASSDQNFEHLRIQVFGDYEVIYGPPRRLMYLALLKQMQSINKIIALTKD